MTASATSNNSEIVIHDRQRGDPVIHLNEDCMSKVLSFLVETKPFEPWEELQEIEARNKLTSAVDTHDNKSISSISCLKDAFELFGMLEEISGGWKECIHHILSNNLLELTFQFDFGVFIQDAGVDAKAAAACLSWASCHSFALASLKCDQQMLREHDVLVKGIIDLLECTDTTDTCHVAISVRFLEEREECRSLQRKIAENCPNLSHLKVVLPPNTEPRDLDKKLFSLPTLQYLKVYFDELYSHRYGGVFHNDILVKILKKLPNIHTMVLGSATEHMISRRLWIASKTLRVLHVRGFKCTCQLQANLPALQQYWCSGNGHPFRLNQPFRRSSVKRCVCFFDGGEGHGLTEFPFQV